MSIQEINGEFFSPILQAIGKYVDTPYRAGDVVMLLDYDAGEIRVDLKEYDEDGTNHGKTIITMNY